jgi:hypothetical protein
MAIMGPTQISVIQTGVFDRPTLSKMWTPAEAHAKAEFRTDRCGHRKASATYASLLGAWTDAGFRADVDMFGNKTSRGYLLVNLVLGGHGPAPTPLSFRRCPLKY